jgi:hypothetical protein
MNLTGGCLCGAVCYEAAGPPDRVGYCHCRTCQKASGAPVAVGVFFRDEAFRFTRGRPRFYRSSEIAERGFCPDCGSRLVYRPLGSGWISVEVGSLDRPEAAPPTYHTGIESQVSWFTLDDGLPRKRTGESFEDG